MCAAESADSCRSTRKPAHTSYAPRGALEPVQGAAPGLAVDRADPERVALDLDALDVIERGLERDDFGALELLELERLRRQQCQPREQDARQPQLPPSFFTASAREFTWSFS